MNLQRIINELGYEKYCKCKDINQGKNDILYGRYRSLHLWQSRTKKALLKYLKHNFDLSNPDEYNLNSLMFYLVGIYLYETYSVSQNNFNQRYTLIVNNLLKSEFKNTYNKTICSTADMSFFLSFFSDESFITQKNIYPLSSVKKEALNNLISCEVVDCKETFKKLVSVFF